MKYKLQKKIPNESPIVSEGAEKMTKKNQHKKPGATWQVRRLQSAATSRGAAMLPLASGAPKPSSQAQRWRQLSQIPWPLQSRSARHAGPMACTESMGRRICATPHVCV